MLTRETALRAKYLVKQMAMRVAQELDLPEDWLNENVGLYVWEQSEGLFCWKTRASSFAVHLPFSCWR
jgi:hypothetical protein